MTQTLPLEEQKINSDDIGSNANLIDRGYGLIMGGAIGDALGSFVEFSFSAISDEQMEIVLSMPGEGGTWNNCCTKGQVTDDTEIGMALLYALLRMKNENNNKFDPKYICDEYYKWYESGPFDIGKTTSKSITQCDKGQNVDKMIEASRKHNINTKEKYRGLGGVRSNGSLMRIMPLILYCYNIYSTNQSKQTSNECYDIIYRIVKTESSLTHYNQIVFHCCMSYCVAAIYLLHHCDEIHEKDRNKGAYFEAKDWLLSQLKMYYDEQNDTESKDDEESDNDIDEEDTLETKIARCTEVLEWLFNGVEKEDDECQFSSTTRNIGHIKIAFERAFWYLYNGSDYTTAMREVIQSGGDTDTNANIVGALLGCYYGLQELREQTSEYKWIEGIKECKPKVDYEKRKVYQPRVCFEQKLVEQTLL
eukprot:832053_1